VRKLVIDSIETPNGDRCVDIFRRPDETFGFEVYRRDPEALTGWFAIGGFAGQAYQSEQDTRDDAAKHAPWLTKK